MNNQFFPLTVHNCTNDDLICRYMNGGTVGTSEVRIGPRGQKMLTDGYMGMTIYASNSFDPSTPYTSLVVNQHVDEVHFTENSGDFGRGNPVGPPPSMRDESSEKSRQLAMQRQQMQKKEDILPGDSADIHGTGLSSAYSGDLLHQGGGGGVESEMAAGVDGGQVYVPGMGYMNPETIPPELLQQLQMREKGLYEAGAGSQIAQGPSAQFPDYDAQGRVRSIEGQPQLPPIKLSAKKKQRLTGIERYLSECLCKYCRFSKHRADGIIRPLLIVGVIAAGFLLHRYYYRRHR